MFKGEYSHTIDTKGRMIMPSKYRELLGDVFTITRGFDKCLMAFDQAGWENFEQKIRSLPVSKPSARKAQRYFIGGSQDVEIDKQGRALIPAVLREHAGLGKEIVLMGVGNYIEIWDKATWESEGCFDDFSTVAQELDELGIEL
ncbi:MAG: division/cell wall cluster transcriptional repressor MraZ [Lachnospiraceae bacterium]|nr:division/cell wall cluster transcriptional repressor MraZ [Lachnospiraceae bacterium]